MAETTHEQVGGTQRHHFVPQFYLKKWYERGSKGFWLYFRNPKGNVSLKQRPAASVGYINNLYSIRPDGLSFQNTVSHDIESKIFAEIDARASEVYRKLLTSGVTSLNQEERLTWALFVNSLLERSPTRLKEVEALSADIPDQMIADMERENPSLMARPEMRSRLEQMDREIVVANATRLASVRCIGDMAFVEGLAGLQWRTIDMPSRDDHFLTGDSPLVINGSSVKSPIHLLSLPLSPRRLMVMYKPAPEFDADFFALHALMINPLIVRQTERHLVSSRRLQDSQFIKYTKLVASELRQPT